MSDAEQIQEIASAVMRANATKVFTVKCTACGKEHTQNLRWLQTKRFICPSCGGKLDDFPLHQLTLSAMHELKKGTKSQKKKTSKQAATVSDKEFDAANGYQLVLQFRGGSLDDFDAMVALEEELTEELGDSAFSFLLLIRSKHFSKRERFWSAGKVCRKLPLHFVRLMASVIP